MKGRKPPGKAWLLPLPRTAPVLATLVTQPGLCGYIVSKSFEKWFVQALLYATCWCVGLWNYLWKGFWKSKYFSLSWEVTVKVGVTVTFSIGYFHFLHCLHEKRIFDIVHCASAPWSAEQWAHKTESKRGTPFQCLTNGPLGRQHRELFSKRWDLITCLLPCRRS